MSDNFNSGEKKFSAQLSKKYQTRITLLKKAREAYAEKNLTLASSLYHEYLHILSAVYDEDLFRLTPKLISDKIKVTEMLLISHVYWDLCRIYEMTPKLQESFYKYLNQFIIFTIDQPYQVLNSEMLRKHIKNAQKSGSNNIRVLEKAYSRIHIESKKCFISTLCFGESSTITAELRNFKETLAKSTTGLLFISFYYRISHRIVEFSKKSSLLRKISIIFFKPLVYFVHKIIPREFKR